MLSFAVRPVMAAMAILIAGCTTSQKARPTPAQPTSEVIAGTTAPSAQSHPNVPLGDFPAFPEGPLPEPVAASLQAVLNDAVEQGTFLGVTAAVIAADSGSWSGAAGADTEQNPLTPNDWLLIARVGKTVTAAQVLRLVEDGKLGLDDPVTDHLPPELPAAPGCTHKERCPRTKLLVRRPIPMLVSVDPPGAVERIESRNSRSAHVSTPPRGSSAGCGAVVNLVLPALLLCERSGHSLVGQP